MQMTFRSLFFFSLFELGGIAKHLAPRETMNFVSPRPQCRLGAQRNKLYCFPWSQSSSASCNDQHGGLYDLQCD